MRTSKLTVGLLTSFRRLLSLHRIYLQTFASIVLGYGADVDETAPSIHADLILNHVATISLSVHVVCGYYL